MKNTLLGILGFVTFLAIVTVMLFYFGVIGNYYDKTIGKQQMDIQRENFEHNKSYVHGKVDDLAQYKREYERAATKAEKEQVRNFILDEFANFDVSQINNPDLQTFLMKMEDGQ